MKIILFGANGMVGQGVRECLLAEDVDLVRTIGRTPVAQANGKLKQVVHPDLLDYRAIEDEMKGFDACFFCLGVSSVGMSEEEYTRVTHDFTLAAASTLARLNPQMTFVYVTGAGTDSTGQGRTMWARVKGRTENELLRLPFKAAYMLRPGFIQPLHGIRSRTRLYRLLYPLAEPLLPLIRRLFPNTVLTTESIGRAMLEISKNTPSRMAVSTVMGRPLLIISLMRLAGTSMSDDKRALASPIGLRNSSLRISPG